MFCLENYGLKFPCNLELQLSSLLLNHSLGYSARIVTSTENLHWKDRMIFVIKPEYVVLRPVELTC